MQSLSARKRRRAFFKSHTSPSLIQGNNSLDLASTRQKDESSERLSLPNIDELNGSAYPATLAQKEKFQPQKRSRFKVLLSPRNPYEEFHKLFTDIPADEFPINDYSCALSRDILLHGRLFLTKNWLCFYSNIFGFETVVKLELRKVKSVARAKTAYMFPNAILVRTEKKKYLFCSFLMRDGAHKLLSTIWQESNNNKPDSGVGEASGNGDQDEEESENLEEVAEYNNSDMQALSHDFTPPKDPALWNIGKCHHRTVSCPNTPLTRHSSVEEHPEIKSTPRSQYYLRRSLSINAAGTFFTGIVNTFRGALRNIYYWLSPLEWLFRKNKFSAESFLLLSSIFVIFLLISTYVLMDRISRLENRFHQTLPVPDQNFITGQQSHENWCKILKEHEDIFREKTERFNEALNGLILSLENVQSKLKVIKDELPEPTAIH